MSYLSEMPTYDPIKSGYLVVKETPLEKENWNDLVLDDGYVPAGHWTIKKQSLFAERYKL